MLKYSSTSFLLNKVNLETKVGNLSEEHAGYSMSNLLIVGIVSNNSDSFLCASLDPGGHIKLREKKIGVNFQKTSVRSGTLLT